MNHYIHGIVFVFLLSLIRYYYVTGSLQIYLFWLYAVSNANNGHSSLMNIDKLHISNLIVYGN